MVRLQASPIPEQETEEKRVTAKALVSVVIIALVIGAFAAAYVGSQGVRTVTTTVTTTAGRMATTVSTITESTSFYGSSNLQANCSPGSGSSTPVSAPNPNYDVQEVMVFAQSYSRLAFNVTAVAQCDASGYGPAYLLNGLSNTGYWYQVGINWNWPLQNGGYNPGFSFVAEAWAPGGQTRSPPSTPFSGAVNPNDTIELSLSFSGGNVIASAQDLNTGASGSMTYPANRATEFVGSQAQLSHSRFSFETRGYFTGLMTEWYHVNSTFSGPERAVTYSETTAPITMATLGVGEWNFTSTVPSSVFSDVANNGYPTDFGAQPNQLQQFSLNGYTLMADSYEFVTD